jgi:hypothetical protein
VPVNKEIKSGGFGELNGEFFVRAGMHEGKVNFRYDPKQGLLIKMYGAEESEPIKNQDLVAFSIRPPFCDPVSSAGCIVDLTFKDELGEERQIVLGVWRGAADEIECWAASVNRSLRSAQVTPKTFNVD